MTKDVRRKPRVGVREQVRLRWNDAYGVQKIAAAVTSEVSKTGIRLELNKEIPPGTVVSLDCHGLKLIGVAVARHCRRAPGNHYTVGLEFSGGLECVKSAGLPT